MEAAIKALNEQKTAVRDMKAAGASKEDVAAAVAKMKALEAEVANLSGANSKEAKEAKAKQAALRAGLDNLLLSRAFVIPAFEIYGAVAGLYDYGPPGAALMNNLQAYWRQHFVNTESMLEVSCTSLTPEAVLKASGHVDRFQDYMVVDSVTGEFYRADKLLEEVCEQKLAQDNGADPAFTEAVKLISATAGSMGKDALTEAFAKLQVVSAKGNPLSDVTAFNLMFKTSIGPTGKAIGYLRPETAQGIFVNFRRLYEANNRRLPFAAAQIGLAYRNEIAPRAGLLRVREFPLAEIEHFVNPEDKTHVRFADVKDYEVDLLPQSAQDGNNKTTRMSIGAAVASKVIDNETLGYFMARTHMFLVNVGINPAKLRFRQHLADEMAHYAKDCWDAEIETTYGWIECVGHADRSAYDLKVHTEHSKVDLSANEPLKTPVTVTKLKAQANRGAVIKAFPEKRAQAAELFAALDALSQDDAKALQTELATAGKATVAGFELDAALLSVKEVSEKVSSVSFLPSVIEPSFGLGRIIYAVLEHAYDLRAGAAGAAAADDERQVLKLAPLIAPVKLGLYNVVSNIEYAPVFSKVRTAAIKAGLTVNEDTSKASIGRKYARGDQIGIPFAISVDSVSVEQGLVTVRERDSMVQILVTIEESTAIVAKLISGELTWAQCLTTYKVVSKE